MSKVELQVFLKDADIELQTLEHWVTRRWIVPTGEGQAMALTETDCARVLLIRELQGDFGVNDEGMDIVLHLLDQLHGMRNMVAALRGELDAARQQGERDGA